MSFFSAPSLYPIHTRHTKSPGLSCLDASIISPMKCTSHLTSRKLDVNACKISGYLHNICKLWHLSIYLLMWMLILTYFSLASKLQTLWSKDCGRMKHQTDKSCLKTGPKWFWSILCQGFTLLAQRFTLLPASKINNWYWYGPTPWQ